MRNDNLDKAKISAAAACAIVVVLGTAGYTAYRDLSKDLPSKDVVANNTERIENTIRWDKEEFAKIYASQAASEFRLHQEIVELGHRLEIIEGVDRDILSRLPRKVAER